MSAPAPMWLRWLAGSLLCMQCAGPAGAAGVPIVPAVPIAMLGDSDSQSYHDSVWTAPGGRGGRYFDTTFQWGEVLAQLRPQALDPGPWGIWGWRTRVAQAADWVGLDLRAPRKQDFRNNLAFAGAHCADLNEGTYRQAPRLRALMDAEPERWRQGVVVIRIGIVDFGGANELDRLAADPEALAEPMARCARHVEQAVRLLRAGHPALRVVLVGILNNADWPPYHERWNEGAQIARIQAGLDRYDAALRAIAASAPGISFFDDRAWFARQWGGRDAQGRPAYRVRRVGTLEVAMTQGDAPGHAVLEDGHAGAAWNLLWAQALVEHLRERHGLDVPSITEAEVAHFAGRLAAASARD